MNLLCLRYINRCWGLIILSFFLFFYYINTQLLSKSGSICLFVDVVFFSTFEKLWKLLVLLFSSREWQKKHHFICYHQSKLWSEVAVRWCYVSWLYKHTFVLGCRFELYRFTSYWMLWLKFYNFFHQLFNQAKFTVSPTITSNWWKKVPFQPGHVKTRRTNRGRQSWYRL